MENEQAKRSVFEALQLRVTGVHSGQEHAVLNN